MFSCCTRLQPTRLRFLAHFPIAAARPTLGVLITPCTDEESALRALRARYDQKSPVITIDAVGPPSLDISTGQNACLQQQHSPPSETDIERHSRQRQLCLRPVLPSSSGSSARQPWPHLPAV